MLIKVKRGWEIPESAVTDETGVQGFMSGSAARNQCDLARGRGIHACHECWFVMDLDEIRMRSREPVEALRQDILDRIDKLLHSPALPGASSYRWEEH